MPSTRPHAGSMNTASSVKNCARSAQVPLPGVDPVPHGEIPLERGFHFVAAVRHPDVPLGIDLRNRSECDAAASQTPSLTGAHYDEDHPVGESTAVGSPGTKTEFRPRSTRTPREHRPREHGCDRRRNGGSVRRRVRRARRCRDCEAAQAVGDPAGRFGPRTPRFASGGADPRRGRADECARGARDRRSRRRGGRDPSTPRSTLAAWRLYVRVTRHRVRMPRRVGCAGELVRTSS